MRVLHISNHSSGRCGVSLFGLQCSAALRAEGIDVVDWDGHYPPLHAREEQGLPSYLPNELHTYDVIHLNWQPATLNHYQSGMFPAGIHHSVFLHDLPPWSTCVFLDRMNTRFALEPFEGATEIPPPAPDYRSSVQRASAVTIGRSNIREAGRDQLADICRRYGWDFNDSSPEWLTEEQEVDRLAKSWVNVVWYTENRSRGSAAMVCAAAGRPLLLNSESQRFGHLHTYSDVVYYRRLDQLEDALIEIVEQVSLGLATVPTRMADDFSWRKAAKKMIATWRSAGVPA